MQVVFATCDQNPLITADDQVLADALRECGVDVEPIPWTAIDPYSILDAPPIVLRSTWDYHRVPTLFLSWLQALDDSGRTLWNPASIARGNVDKIYLQTLEASGITIPKTRWIARADPAAISRVMIDEGWDRAVLKPRVAATPYGTFLIDRSTMLSGDDLAPARASGALLQEVIPDVHERGETSLVFVDGQFSHAVVKTAVTGEFRVQQDFGGRVAAAAPSAEALNFAIAVTQRVPDDWLYARVDIVETARGPLLMELELIEPELYFLHAPEAATRMAAAIVRRMS